MRFLALLLALAALAPSLAAAEARVRVVETAPPDATATLAADEPFYMRLQFETDEEVRLWARPYFRGQPAEKGGRFNASARHTGAGYALAWVAFANPAEIDEIRIVAGGGRPYREDVVASHRVQVRWTTERAAATAGTPDWAETLQREANDAARAAARAQPSGGGSDGLVVAVVLLLPVILLALVLGSTLLPAWALWKWRGGWRIAALAPIAVIAFVVLRIAVDVARDPTSHNLWPFELALYAGPCILFLAGLGVARRFVARRA